MFSLPLKKQLTKQLTLPESLELERGLIWIAALLTPTQQQRLLKLIDSGDWQQPLWLPQHHRLQVYGWRERPTCDLSRLSEKRDYLGFIPFGFSTLQQRLKPWMPCCDQIVVHTASALCPLTCPTERSLHTLAPGLHVDHSKNYGNVIVTVALSPIKLVFRRGMREPIVVELDAGDALVMRDVFRYQWLHQVLFDDAISQTFLTLRTLSLA